MTRLGVLVTGATGLLGGAVAPELAARGHAVRALVRPAPAPSPPPARSSRAATSSIRRACGRPSPERTRSSTPPGSRASARTAETQAERELGYSVRPCDEMLRDALRFALETGRLTATTAALRALAPG